MQEINSYIATITAIGKISSYVIGHNFSPMYSFVCRTISIRFINDDIFPQVSDTINLGRNKPADCRSE